MAKKMSSKAKAAANILQPLYKIGDIATGGIVSGIVDQTHMGPGNIQMEAPGDETEMERTERLRKQGISESRGAATASSASAKELREMQDRYGRAGERAVGALEEAGRVGRAGMRMQAAQALRAGGQARGGNIAAMRQSGLQMGQALAGQEAGTAKQIAAQRLGTAGDMYKLAGQTGQAEVEAKMQGLEATKFEKEAGSGAEDRAMKTKEYTAQISKIKKDHKGGLGGMLPDDEEGAADAIEALAAAEPDPEIKKFLFSQANKARRDI